MKNNMQLQVQGEIYFYPQQDVFRCIIKLHMFDQPYL